MLFMVTITLIACKTEPKDYVTLSGKITNKNSDSIQIRTRTYSKTIHVNEDGTFSDTLKVETGVYAFYDGTESTSVFLKNGYDLSITLDTEMFDETVKYNGDGSEHSNFLAEKSLLEEQLLDIDKLSELSLEDLPEAMDNLKKQLSDFYSSNKAIDTSITNSALNNIDPMLKFYKGYIGDAITLKTELYKGAPSPKFEDYENYAGGTTSLDDLKGKYVYVDVWATWCGPCKAEIPSLKKVEAQYHGKNIEFVSLSIDKMKDHDAWRKMIKDKELGGVQVFADNDWKSQFVVDYKIKGIPRFILIDPNGNVVTPDAPRPSNSKLVTLFEELEIK